MGSLGQGGTLLAVILINVIIGFVQEYKAEKAINALMSMDVQKGTWTTSCRVSAVSHIPAKVIREGQQDEIEANQLVPGDIVVLDEGDQSTSLLAKFFRSGPALPHQFLLISVCLKSAS